MIQTSTDGPSTPLPKSIRMSKAMVDKAANLAQIQVNNDILTVSQLARLKDIHKTSIKAFDDVMTGEYTNKDHPYLSTFSFREENMAPPYKIWVPQFNRGCQDLMQDKCHQLAEQGVLVDRKAHNIDIPHMKPCFIQGEGQT